MNYGLFDLLVVGLFAMMIAVVVILAMVHFELGPAARLVGYKRWLLASALGSGVLAFALKLLIMLIITTFPQTMIASLRNADDPSLRHASTPSVTTPPRYGWTPITPAQAGLLRTTASQPVPYVWQTLPEQAPAPVDNPTTPQKVALGEQLFFDPALSRDGTVSCTSCHDVRGKAGTDGRSISRGIDGQRGARNAPTVWNAAFQAVLFWDGRAASLEEQAKGPLLNPLEMGMPSPDVVEERVRAQPHYRSAFAQAFGADKEITFERIAQAIAAYERTLITTDAPYDRFVRGDLSALRPDQLRGMALFQSVGCVNCHFGPNFSAASLFDARAPRRSFPANPTQYEQRYDLVRDTGAAAASTGRGVWRVPSLRNVALTGPWLHNGEVKELKEVVRIMASAQLGRSGHYLMWSDQNRVLSVVDRQVLSETEIDEIVAFLQALSSESLAKKVAGAT